MKAFSASLIFVAAYLHWPLPDSKDLAGGLSRRVRKTTRSLIGRVSTPTNWSAEITHTVLLCTSYLGAGLHFEPALSMALSETPEPFLRHTKSALRRQSDVSEALNRDVSNQQLSNLAPLVVAAKISQQTGMSMVGMLTSILEHIKQEENRNTLMRQEIASTRASVIILAALPAVGILLSLILGANSLNWLASTSMGRVCGMVGIVLEGIGVYWLSKMVKRATSR
ncbi:unannotated protein [freshwater metagenome]|uniref:Unannotated protein n=1 Tax=freshwater metagenome TaxID=449393 RepID=A0A6J5YS72_9ZZZZ